MSGPARADGSLYELIDERLEWMAQVAAYKWLHQLPVEDIERERIVIEASVENALKAGIDPETSTLFFAAQIDAAKSIQRFWFARYEAGEEPQSTADLSQTIRPRLLALGEEILSAAVQNSRAGARPDERAFRSKVSVHGLSDPQVSRLFDSVLGLRVFENRLQQILGTGRLRVGTTGDYAPFSHSGDGSASDSETSFSGIDIDLARDLANALGVQVVFVQTSWPTLEQDLMSGEYDIAMSGVSRTLKRQRIGFMSTAYYTGGKTPISRCADAEEYGSLSAIDRPGVRVVVNPGGTNEQFVDANLSHATKLMHPDNRTIFEQIRTERADVMITDRIEVELQTGIHNDLCSTMDENLTYQEKGFLMPQDIELKTFVDMWLELRTGDGTLQHLFRERRVPTNRRPFRP